MYFPREKIATHYDEDKHVTLFNIFDGIEKSLREHTIYVSKFLSPDWHESIVNTVKGHCQDCHVFLDGGYEGAELKRLVVCHEYVDLDSIEAVVEVLSVTYNTKFATLDHRDCLGALMNLGIQREKMGDIVAVDDGFFIVTDGELTDYIAMQLTKIGRASVKVKVIDAGDLPDITPNLEIATINVSSLRLDAVVAAIAHVGRQQGKNMVEKEKVKVNHQVLVNPSQMVEENDLLSIRGRGRVYIQAILGETKKGRLRVQCGFVK